MRNLRGLGIYTAILIAQSIIVFCQIYIASTLCLHHTECSDGSKLPYVYIADVVVCYCFMACLAAESMTNAYRNIIPFSTARGKYRILIFNTWTCIYVVVHLKNRSFWADKGVENAMLIYLDVLVAFMIAIAFNYVLPMHRIWLLHPPRTHHVIRVVNGPLVQEMNAIFRDARRRREEMNSEANSLPLVHFVRNTGRSMSF